MAVVSGQESDVAARRGVQTAVVVFMLGLIVFQVVQPALFDRVPDRQSEFVWEMFSKAAPREEFEIRYPDTSETVTPAQVLEPARANIDYTRVLPEFLCEQRPDATEVATYRNGAVIGVRECGSA